MKKRIFALVDCNNFYVSCEKVFKPSLEGQPVIVLSNNDGCIISRSNEAKQLGIKMAQPVFQCKELIAKHNIQIFSANFVLYGDMSQRVMNTLRRFTPELEIYSIDEAFLSFTNFIPKDIIRNSKKIRDVVKQWTGIPISIGIGPTKTLAKVANKIAKKHTEFGGVFDITNHPRKKELLSNLDVIDVWGIGRQFARFLGKHRIKNVLQFINADEKWVKENMTVGGLRTLLELKGVPCADIDEVHDSSKTILSSRTFAQSIREVSDLKEAIASYVSIAAEKLRAQKLVASMIHVFVTTNRFNRKNYYSNSYYLELSEPTAYTPILISYASRALDEIFKKGYEYKRAGVLLTGLCPTHSVQRSMFPGMTSELQEKKNRLMSFIDRLNFRWGRGTVKSCAAGINKVWDTVQSQRSPRYTTNWDELLTVGF
ncbi:Y-family DNA polymerase [Candidatus Dojkabacteria bacterium]|nr:Y-family DNA polymerase [Candidatus Dojkabacteria bacterium]